MYTKERCLLIVVIILVALPIINATIGVGLIRDNNWSNNLTGVFYGSLAFGDIDNDGDSDLVSMGCTSGGFTNCATADKIRIYTNNGTTFNENSTWETNTTNLGYGSLAFGDIDNDGDLDLIVTGDKGGGSGTVRVYVNNGTTFNEDSIWQTNLVGIDAFNGALAIGDVDNDGYLDLALVGANPVTGNGIYINNGTSFVEDSNWVDDFALVGQGNGGGALIFGDYDNDGDLDLAFAGSLSTNFYTKIYINNGTSLVDNSSWKGDFGEIFGFPSLALGDYDNDGFIDLAAIGARAGDHLQFYNNTGTNFSLQQENNASNDLAGYLEGSIAFGDYDNDGDLDFGAMGRESGRNRIYVNNNSLYSQDSSAQTDMKADNMEWGGLAWFDVDGDNNLDLAINGYNPDDTFLFKIYISNASLTKNNTQPNASTSGFSSSYSDGVLNLSWNNGSDIETNSSGLYYNLMVGNSTKNHTIVSGIYGGSSNPTAGYFGNMMQRKNISFNKFLSADTYYWYVQTIDTGLVKSNWSARQSIVIGADTTPPNISSVSSSVTSSTATITWTTDESANSTVYYGTTTALGSSSGLSSLVSSHSISLSSLSASTLYYYNVSSCDFWNNCNTSIQYNFTTSAAPASPVSPGGGGSSGSSTTTFWTNTYAVSDEDFSKGYVKELSKKQRVKVSVSDKIHYVGVVDLTNTTATINITSDPIQVILSVGDDIKLDLTDDGFYDIYVLLNSIENEKANLTIKSIYEEISVGEGPVETSGEIVGDGKSEEGIKGKIKGLRFWISGIIGLVVFVLISIFLKKYLWKKELRKRKKVLGRLKL